MQRYLDNFRPREAAKKLILAGLFLALCNLPFWILSWQFFLNRPLFNADVLLALMIAVVNPIMLAPVLFVVWLIDAMQSLSLAYHFYSLADFALSANFLQYLNLADLLNFQAIGIALLFTATTVLIITIFRNYKPSVWALVAITGILLAVDVTNGTGLPAFFGSLRNSQLAAGVNVQGSPLMNFANSLSYSHEQASKPYTKLQSNKAPVSEVVEWAQNNPEGSVLVILVESWGWHIDPVLRSWVTQPLTTSAMSNRFTIQVYAMPFRGTTTAGELRTLCAIAGHYSSLNTKIADDCLPNQLYQQGYDSVGLHGFSSRMFERDRWWPKIGLTNRIFAEDLQESTPRCGGAFRGICDDFLLGLAFSRLKSKRLVYVLTLNTHLPLKPVAIPSDLTEICKLRQVSESVCQLTGQLGNLMSQLATYTAKYPGTFKVVVGGDHSPPFINQADREAFSSTHVPEIILTSK